MEKDKREALELLKGEFIEIYTELNYLKEEEGKTLEALYYSKIGYKELELHEKEIVVLSLKRKIEILNSWINTGRELDFSEIEKIVEIELEKYYTKLFQLSTQIAISNYRLENLIPVKVDIHNLYRKLAKKLHPDFNEFTELLQEYWGRLQKYYETQNLEGMKALELILNIETLVEEIEEENIQEKIDEILEKIKVLYKEKWELLEKYPYNMKIYIEDENWVKEKLETIENDIEQLKIKIEALQLMYVGLSSEVSSVWVN